MLTKTDTLFRTEIPNPVVVVVPATRQQRRARVRAELKAERRSEKHSVRDPEAYDTMPPDVAAGILADPKQRLSNPFRKVCKAARTRVRVATRADSKDEEWFTRRLAGRSMAQLVHSFKRSHAKRFKHLPKALKKLTGTTALVEKKRKILHAMMEAHDENIRRVSDEIARRIGKRGVA